ncbi:MAG: hypothetical protein AMXMBFR8_18070 [Nevskiales bacterium]|nr:hypothetical protein [Burkholderiaceae bacterium]
MSALGGVSVCSAVLTFCGRDGAVLTMRSLDIRDTSAKLSISTKTGLLGAGIDGTIPLLGQAD